MDDGAMILAGAVLIVVVILSAVGLESCLQTKHRQWCADQVKSGVVWGECVKRYGPICGE